MNYLETAQKILKISCTPEEYPDQGFNAPLFAAQALAAAAIAQAEMMVKIEKRLRYIGACLADLCVEAEGGTLASLKKGEYR